MWIQFKKETAQLALNEERHYKEQIDKLNHTVCDINNKRIEVKHSLQLTIVDGKICNALSDTSAVKCYICNAKLTEMNDLEKCLEKNVNKNSFEFGLSPLHSYIRFFKYFLNGAFRLDQKSWQRRENSNFL